MKWKVAKPLKNAHRAYSKHNNIIWQLKKSYKVDLLKRLIQALSQDTKYVQVEETYVQNH